MYHLSGSKCSQGIHTSEVTLSLIQYRVITISKLLKESGNNFLQSFISLQNVGQIQHSTEEGSIICMLAVQFMCLQKSEDKVQCVKS